jgi:hypothetical protein
MRNVKRGGGTSRRPAGAHVVIVLCHALVLWALCGATIGIGRALVGIETTLIVHAWVVPVFASLIASFYFRKFGQVGPLATAAIFTGFVITLDAGLVAPVFEKSFEMFNSILGTWVPFGLIFVSTLLTGLVARRSGNPARPPGNPFGTVARAPHPSNREESK